MKSVAVFNDDFPKGIYALLSRHLDIAFLPYSCVYSLEEDNNTDMIVLRDQMEIECECHREKSVDHTTGALRSLRRRYMGDIAVWFAVSFPHEYDYIFHEGADFIVEPQDFTGFMRNYAAGIIAGCHFNPGKYEQLPGGLVVPKKQRAA